MAEKAETTSDPSERRLLVALNRAPDLARDSICRLALRTESWRAGGNPRRVGRNLGLPASDIDKARRSMAGARGLAESELRRTQALGARVVTVLDRDYPAELRHLDLPPPVLSLRGRLPDAPRVAIVGSRKATPAGIETAELFGRELAASGLVVVSGFARGIDAAAHRGALSAPAGTTVAVLGCGLDVDYPRRSRRLAADIAASGGLLTEFPLGTQPLARHFPIRNRIIAALSLGTLVVQATPRSGSLITARLALDLGRDVYAVPGPIFDRRSAGPNTLIRDGALLVQHPRDILEALPTAVQQGLRTVRDDPQVEAPTGLQREILRHLSRGELLSADRLAARLGHPLQGVLGELLELELAGLVRRYAGSVYCRKR